MAAGISKIDLVVHFSNGGRITPDDVVLIEAVRRHRSIIGAGRATGVSYRKCWLTIDALNRMFEAPVFETFPGRKNAGTEITAFGERLLALYRSMERRSRSHCAAALKELEDALDARYRPFVSSSANSSASSAASSAAAAGRSPQARRPQSRRS